MSRLLMKIKPAPFEGAPRSGAVQCVHHRLLLHVTLLILIGPAQLLRGLQVAVVGFEPLRLSGILAMTFRRYGRRAIFSMLTLKSRLEVRLGRSGTPRASAAGEVQPVKRLCKPVGELTTSVRRLPRAASAFTSFTTRLAMAVVRFLEDALDRLHRLWSDHLRGDQLRPALVGLRAGGRVRI